MLVPEVVQRARWNILIFLNWIIIYRISDWTLIFNLNPKNNWVISEMLIDNVWIQSNFLKSKLKINLVSFHCFQWCIMFLNEVFFSFYFRLILLFTILLLVFALAATKQKPENMLFSRFAASQNLENGIYCFKLSFDCLTSISNPASSKMVEISFHVIYLLL